MTRSQPNVKNLIWLFLHVAVWFVQVGFLNSEILYLEWGYFEKTQNNLLLPLSYGMLANAIIFYFQILYLIPKKFSTKRKSYWVQSIVFCLFLSLVVSILDLAYIDYKNIVDLNSFTGPKLFHLYFFNATPRFLWWIIALAYRFPIDWMKKERQKERLYREKLTAELEFLKAQINPHFLFNGINSIYHLIDNQPKKAKNTLLQFSSLLRYQIYECQTDFIALLKEIDYLKNYIGLERIRREGDLVINLDIDDNLEGLDQSDLKNIRIAPLLITPFIENAFKFVSNHEDVEKNHINIAFRLDGHHFAFTISNSCIQVKETKKPNGSGGIGIPNVRKRLELIYPEKHQLNISNGAGTFRVQLNIEL